MCIRDSSVVGKEAAVAVIVADVDALCIHDENCATVPAFAALCVARCKVHLHAHAFDQPGCWSRLSKLGTRRLVEGFRDWRIFFKQRTRLYHANRAVTASSCPARALLRAAACFSSWKAASCSC
eukprot:6213699-Pleurochrysis_carterae.AAC.4